MWNVAWNGGVGMLRRTVVLNAVGDGDVESDGEP